MIGKLNYNRISTIPYGKGPGAWWSYGQRIEILRNTKGKTPSLFKDYQTLNSYLHPAYITNLTLAPAEVWRLYRERAKAKNRIKELKADFGFDSFNLDNFFGTEAALSFAMLANNLKALFRQ